MANTLFFISPDQQWQVEETVGGKVMENRLVKELYGDDSSNLFGLYCGQMRGNDFVHNGGWYNTQGEKLGWGDLSPADIQRIMSELQEGEFFIVLGETDSFWQFVEKPGIIGSMSQTKPEVNAPGVDYVLEHCMFVLAPGKFYYIDHHNKTPREPFTRDGLLFEPITPQKARELTLGVSA